MATMLGDMTSPREAGAQEGMTELNEKQMPFPRAGGGPSWFLRVNKLGPPSARGKDKSDAR